MDKFYQRFKIDDHLRRYPKALQNLSLAGRMRCALAITVDAHKSPAGNDRLQEAFAYVEKHQLYDAALSIWKGTAHYNVSNSHTSFINISLKSIS